ncbi:MAG: hypothetical protein KKF06_07915, partial [Candidatus Margulisbacteria bacterium]|nr:hypothetical protein [Candidatus Margulisiibacteriota bacterium]
QQCLSLRTKRACLRAQSIIFSFASYKFSVFAHFAYLEKNRNAPAFSLSASGGFSSIFFFAVEKENGHPIEEREKSSLRIGHKLKLEVTICDDKIEVRPPIWLNQTKK